MLSISYIMTFHFTPVLELWQKSHSMRNFGHELSTSIAIDQSINQQLQNLMDVSQSHRAYLYRYHNGIASVHGVPFIFHSNTHEVIRAGVSRLIIFNQRLPSGINTHMNMEFSRRKCEVLHDIDRNMDGSNYWYFQTRNAVSMIRCAVYTSEGDLLGFIGIDYTERVAANLVKENEKDVLAAANTISRILERKEERQAK